MNIQLAEGDVVTKNRIVIDREGTTSYYTLPMHPRRAVLYRYGRHADHAQLIIGGFKSITVTVRGTTAQCEQLLEAVL